MMEYPQGVSKRKLLIDADMLRYEVGFGVQFNEPEGVFIHPFDSAKELLEFKIAIMMEETWATEPPTLYLTDDRARNERLSERGIQSDYKPVFREALAKTAPYKGNRTQEKPFHFHNLTELMVNHYDCKIAKGMEADDLMSVDQNIGLPECETVICSRDKDLRITPGKHYSWACGVKPAIPLYTVDKLGWLEEPVKGKLFGAGLKFFYAQTIMGDTVDNIPGIPGKGPAFAYKLLNECETESQMLDRVLDAYEKYTTDWDSYFDEQASLLWIIQELDKDGNPVYYNKKDRRN